MKEPDVTTAFRSAPAKTDEIMDPRAQLLEDGTLYIERGTHIHTLIVQCVESLRRFVAFVRGADQDPNGNSVLTAENRVPVEELWEKVVTLAMLTIASPARAAARPDPHSSQKLLREHHVHRDDFTGRAGSGHPFPRDVHSALRMIVFAWPLPHRDHVSSKVLDKLDRVATFLAEAIRQSIPASASHNSTVWLTVTAAAELLKDVVSGITTEQAKARVSRAASRAKFKTNGKTHTARRIDRGSFSTWLLEQHSKDLDKADDWAKGASR